MLREWLNLLLAVSALVSVSFIDFSQSRILPRSVSVDLTVARSGGVAHLRGAVAHEPLSLRQNSDEFCEEAVPGTRGNRVRLGPCSSESRGAGRGDVWLDLRR